MVKISLNVIIYVLYFNDNKVFFYCKFFNKFNVLFFESFLYFDGVNFIIIICSIYYVFEGFFYCCLIVNLVCLWFLMFCDFYEFCFFLICFCNKEY